MRTRAWRRDYLRRCVQVLADSRTELASCLYVGRTTGGLAAQLDAAGKSVEMTGGILVAEMMERGTKFALGVTMILRKKAFADAGGYEDLGQYYAEGLCAGEPAGGAGAWGADGEPRDPADGAAAGAAGIVR